MAEEKNKDKEKEEEKESKEPVVDIFEKGLSDIDMMNLEPPEPGNVEAPPPVVPEETGAEKIEEEPAPEPESTQEEVSVDELVQSAEPAPEPEAAQEEVSVDKLPEKKSQPARVEVPPEIEAKSAEELAEDIQETVLDAKRIRTEEEQVEKELKKLRSKKKRLDKQLDEDKKKIAEEAEQARRLVEGE